MAKLIRKLEDGRELFGYDFKDVTIKSVGDYEIEIIGSTADQDRDGEVLSPEGWEIGNYVKNPVILPAHDYTQPAIGRAKSVRLEDGKLKFVIEFPKDGVNPLADIYRKLYKDGFMRASSVGFIPIEWLNGDGVKEPRRTYKKMELLELSLVSVPANPAAIVTAKCVKDALEKGIITEADITAIETGKAVVKTDDASIIDVAIVKELVAKVAELEKLVNELKCQLTEKTKEHQHYSDVLFNASGAPEQKDSSRQTPVINVSDIVSQTLKEEFNTHE